MHFQTTACPGPLKNTGDESRLLFEKQIGTRKRYRCARKRKATAVAITSASNIQAIGIGVAT
jgi:hypothetical protein